MSFQASRAAAFETSALRRSVGRSCTTPPGTLWPLTVPIVAVATPIDIKPIGVVRSTLRECGDAPRQPFEGAPAASLELNSAFAPALHRVTPGTELIVVTWLHQADRTVLQVHPMDDESIPLTGVFATRSPDRPNPIGLHRVTVVGIDPPASIRVDALEAIDGTPILDLKVAMRAAPDA
jgi:tRNA-Thr(GGU) m(6)t(6)A37 methyltransferase TsaA